VTARQWDDTEGPILEFRPRVGFMKIGVLNSCAPGPHREFDHLMISLARRLQEHASQRMRRVNRDQGRIAKQKPERLLMKTRMRIESAALPTWGDLPVRESPRRSWILHRFGRLIRICFNFELLKDSQPAGQSAQIEQGVLSGVRFGRANSNY
jgi:hypothetical protein